MQKNTVKINKFSRLKKNRHFLHALLGAKSSMRKAILQNAEPDLIKTVAEIVLNLLHGNIKLSKNHRSGLIKYKSCLRKIGRSDGNLAQKRKVLVQSGGFLPILLSSLLATAVGKLIQ